MFQMARVGFALLFGLTTLARMEAQPMVDAAAPLAARISSLLPRRATVSLEFQVLTPLAMAESSSFRGALEEELRKTGLDLTATAPPESRLRVSVTENVRGLLFVAEVSGKDPRQVVMLPWSRPLPSDAKPALRLVLKPVWEQPEPVLDFMILDSDSQLLILSPTKVTNLRLANGKWALNGQASLTLDRPVARDPRGRLEFITGALRAFLPGTTCSGQFQPQLGLTCSPGNEAWPINPQDPAPAVRWMSDTNELVSVDVKSSFYNAAQGWFVSSNESIQDRAGVTAPGTESWGSDLAAIANPCGSGNVLIISMAGDNREHDQVQLFEMISGQPVVRSEAMAIPGAVTALWPAETPGQATLVVRNSKTGNYEASRLALACAE
jgi:hypothetical protein